jgi:hypothetical protein
VDGDLYAGTVLVDDQVARVEAQEVELGCDQAQALDGGSFAAASTAQGMDLGRDVNHVGRNRQADSLPATEDPAPARRRKSRR